tara:strand:+ start:728 stop:2521 length:1794 start_codon:yes stop_codon:yes gene_type:complete
VSELEVQPIDEKSLNGTFWQEISLDSHINDATIMMVDDEPILMELLQAFLEDQGYSNFITIEDSTKAIDAMHQLQPDILLLDLNMPNLGGLDIIKLMRADSLLKRLPIIVLTSSTDAETKLQALELGATDFLAKPVDASELALRLRNTLTVKAYQDQLAYSDSLTGLLNRSRFLERLEWAIKSASRSQAQLAVMKLNVDRFKQINDALGPKAGDSLIIQIADRLLSSLRGSDVISLSGNEGLWQNFARIGGDEFSILFPESIQTNDISYVTKRLLEAIRLPFSVEGQEVFVTASIGIAIYPLDGQDTDTLTKNASVATEFSKKQGRDNYQFYSEEINKQDRERLSIETELRRAIEQNEFVLHYQPKLSVSPERVVGMEALIRWQHPTKGLLSPFHFIQIAEDSGLINLIGEWVIHEACRQVKQWHEEGLEGLQVSVNVSPQQFTEKNIQASIDAAVSSGLDLQYLELEITESMLMGDEERLIKVMQNIKNIGPRLSIDDFGTGYSSLSYLKRFPLDELKIDRAFIIDIPGSKEDKAIVKAIIAMAKSLDLSIVAEGVETVEQLNFLKETDCIIIQGFYFSKPLPAEAFKRYVLEKNT